MVNETKMPEQPQEATVKKPRKYKRKAKPGHIRLYCRDIKHVSGAVYAAIYSGIESLIDKMIEGRERRAIKQAEQKRQRMLEDIAAKLDVTAIDPNTQCKACGAKSGEIRYDALTKHVIHTCKVCAASWAELPIIKASEWDFSGRDQDEILKRKQQVEALFDNGRYEKPQAKVN